MRMAILMFTMCSSRKYPYPPHGRSLEIPKGRGGSEAKISEGSGGLKSKLFPEGGKQFVTNEIILT